MDEAGMISKIVFDLPIYSFNVADDEVIFRLPGHVPSSSDSIIPMNFKSWNDLGKPMKISIEIIPL